MKIKLTEEHQRVLQENAAVVETGLQKFLHLPFFYLEIDKENSIYEMLSWDELPEHVQYEFLKTTDIDIP